MQVAQEVGFPKSIRIDNGPEFTSRVLDQWAYLNGVELDFIRPGKPTDNALIESFNERFREECLNESWFLSLDDAKEKVEEWSSITIGRGRMDLWETCHQLNLLEYKWQNKMKSLPIVGPKAGFTSIPVTLT